MHKVLMTTLAAILASSGGCSVFRPARQSILITPSEPNALVYVDGAQVGSGTTSVDLQRNKSHSVVAKVGERSGSAAIGTKISTTGILDIAGGFIWLVPFAGIAAPGFYDLDTTSVHVPIPLDPAKVSQASYEQN